MPFLPLRICLVWHDSRVEEWAQDESSRRELQQYREQISGPGSSSTHACTQKCRSVMIGEIRKVGVLTAASSALVTILHPHVLLETGIIVFGIIDVRSMRQSIAARRRLGGPKCTHRTRSGRDAWT